MMAASPSTRMHMSSHFRFVTGQGRAMDAMNAARSDSVPSGLMLTKSPSRFCSKQRTSDWARAPRLTWRARELHDLRQRSLRSASGSADPAPDRAGATLVERNRT